MSYSAEAQEKRQMAARARRLAGSLTAEADQAGLLRAAQQLEKEAQQLEDQEDGREANAGPPPSEQKR